MKYELIEMTGSVPEDNEFPKVVIEENGDFSTAYFYNGEWRSSETQNGWFNRTIRNVTRWFEIRPTKNCFVCQCEINEGELCKKCFRATWGGSTKSFATIEFLRWYVERLLTRRATDAASPASKNGEGSKKPRG